MIDIELTIDPDLEKKIINSFRLHLNGVFKRAASSIKRRVGEVCDKLIKRTPEYNSLLSGELLGELGVPDVDAKLDAILKTIQSSCEVESLPIQKAGDHLTGGIVIRMIKSDFLDILGLGEAEYQSEKGMTIPWLSWLLLQGDKILVVGYDVDFNLTPREKKYVSRTHLAIMRKGSGWRIEPSEFTGTLNDNFITRAFVPEEIEKLLIQIMQEEITTRL